jgi:hypothetical protein
MASYKSKELRAYIYDLLNTNITYNSVVVPVYNRAIAGSIYPHITVSVVQFVETGDKQFFGGVYQVNVEVVDRFPINEGGQDSIDDLSNEITNLVSVRNNSRRFGDSYMVSLRYSNDITREEEDEQYRYEYRLITFEAEIHQDGQTEVVAGDILQGDLELDLNG